MEGARGLVGGLLCKDTNPIPESPTLITWSPQMPQFQIPSDWELGFNIGILDGTCIHSMVLATVSAREDWGFCLKLLGFIGATQVSGPLKREMEGSSRTVCCNWTGAPGGLTEEAPGWRWWKWTGFPGLLDSALEVPQPRKALSFLLTGWWITLAGGAVCVSVHIVLLGWDFRSKVDAMGVTSRREYQWQNDWKWSENGDWSRSKTDEGEETPLPPP